MIVIIMDSVGMFDLLLIDTRKSLKVCSDLYTTVYLCTFCLAVLTKEFGECWCGQLRCVLAERMNE